MLSNIFYGVGTVVLLLLAAADLNSICGVVL